jgi:DNA-binding MarR family transcriptional regulator
MTRKKASSGHPRLRAHAPRDIPRGAAKAGAPIDAPGRRRLPATIRRAWFGLNQAFRRRILHLGLTPDQFTILRWLIESAPRGLTQRELAAMMLSDPNTITAILKRMQSSGMIRRSPDEQDRRANRIQIRPRGRGKYNAARRFAVDLQHQILESLPAGRREAFLAELECVADACSAAARESSRGARRTGSGRSPAS